MGCLIAVAVYLTLLPVSLVLSTPVVLVSAFFGWSSYGENVKRGYLKVVEFWIQGADSLGAVDIDCG